MVSGYTGFKQGCEMSQWLCNVYRLDSAHVVQLMNSRVIGTVTEQRVGSGINHICFADDTA